MNLEPVAVNVLVLATQSLLLCTCADCTLYSFQMLKYIVELLIILFQWKTAIPGNVIDDQCNLHYNKDDIIPYTVLALSRKLHL